MFFTDLGKAYVTFVMVHLQKLILFLVIFFLNHTSESSPTSLKENVIKFYLYLQNKSSLGLRGRAQI